MILVKVSFNESKFDHTYRTLGYLRSVNHSEREEFTDYLAERLAYLNESYTSNPIDKINFSYIEKDGLVPEEGRRLLQDVVHNQVSFHRFNNMELPVTMKLEEYGIIRGSTQFDTFTRYFVNNGKRNYEIDVSLDKTNNKVTILGAVDLKWVDTKLTEGGFKREIGKSTKYFLDGVNVLNKQLLPSKPFRRTKLDRKKAAGFITMDIETVKINNKVVPYLICGYNGSEFITSYANSSLDQGSMFSNFVNQLLDRSFSQANNMKVYAHNLSGFDGVFLMKQLLPFGKVDPLIFNGKLISIRLKTPTGQVVTFKDSYLLLPLSLRVLCSAFEVVAPKGYFPFLLTDINYTGVFPKYKFWTNISNSAYDTLKLEHKNKMWSFRDEAIKYCQLDSKVLHEILTKFNELIYNNFSVNIHKSLTLPALAMRIYKTSYMPENSIYQLSNEVESAIRQSYTGGAVDVYIPHNRIAGSMYSTIKALFRRLYYYDVNSLYPFVMATMPMPVGKPIAFEGDIRKTDPEAYGVFYCNIVTPAFLLHPILQRKIKGRGTVAGLGSWQGWISSLEMDNAVKYGYTFEILRGYEFNKGDLFSSYVNKMFELRLEYPKPHPMNLIAKLLMNSLYGKFGMRTDKTVIDIINIGSKEGKKALRELLDTTGESIHDFIELEKNKYLFLRNSVSKVMTQSDLEDSYHGTDVNIAVASTITAGARVHMSYFKNNPNFNLYYSDTDSSVTDRPLPEFMVGNKLGQLKLEHTIKKAVFLGPKNNPSSIRIPFISSFI